jgi:hypothetical protein
MVIEQCSQAPANGIYYSIFIYSGTTGSFTNHDDEWYESNKTIYSDTFRIQVPGDEYTVTFIVSPALAGGEWSASHPGRFIPGE